MLAPIISFATILAVSSLLPPVAHCSELGSGWRAILPEVEHDRLASPGFQARQRRKWATRSTDIFSKCHYIIVFIDQRPNILVAVGVAAFVNLWICTHIDQPAGF